MVSRRSSWIALGFAAILSAALVGLGIGSQCDLCSSGGSDIGISGTARYTNGAPAPGIIICILCDSTNWCDNTSIRCTTNANGEYKAFLGSCPTGDDGWYAILAGHCPEIDSCHSHEVKHVFWDGASHLSGQDFIVHCH